MSSYYPSFNYMGFNSLKDKHLIVTHFDADNGEHDTFLGMDPVYTDRFDGTRRLDYGAKYNNVAVIKITVIKANGSDFTVAEVRDFLRWTTGAKQNSCLDLLTGDTIKYSFLGRVTNAYQQKLDARTIGMAIEFTSISPWAYSPHQIILCSFGQALTVDGYGTLGKGKGAAFLDIASGGVLYNGTDGDAGLFNVTLDGVVYIDNSVKLLINNESDDIYSYIYLETKFLNDNSTDVFIRNNTTNEETSITGLSDGEIVALSPEQFITSSISNKVFGTDFNFVWPRLVPGMNEIIVSGSGIGTIQFAYRVPIKIGDCAIDIYLPNDDCSRCDNSIYGTIDWDDIANAPSTLAGYGITDAYTDDEIDEMIENIEVTGGTCTGDHNIDEKELSDMLNDVLGE